MVRSNVEELVIASCFIGICIAAILLILLHTDFMFSIGMGFLAALIAFVVLLAL